MNQSTWGTEQVPRLDLTLNKCKLLLARSTFPSVTLQKRNKKENKGISIVAQQVKNLTSFHGDVGLIPGLAQWVSDLAFPWAVMSCGVGCRGSSDPALPWLWCRLAATALIWPLAWKLPYAWGARCSPKKEKKNRNKNTKTLECKNKCQFPIQ